MRALAVLVLTDRIKIGLTLRRLICRGALPRLYAPTQTFFDKTWRRDDIVKVK